MLIILTDSVSLVSASTSLGVVDSGDEARIGLGGIRGEADEKAGANGEPL